MEQKHLLVDAPLKHNKRCEKSQGHAERYAQPASFCLSAFEALAEKNTGMLPYHKF